MLFPCGVMLLKKFDTHPFAEKLEKSEVSTFVKFQFILISLATGTQKKFRRVGLVIAYFYTYSALGHVEVLAIAEAINFFKCLVLLKMTSKFFKIK